MRLSILSRIEKDGSYGYAKGKTGEVVIPPQFEQAQQFTEGLAAVMVGGRWGYINEAGQFAIPVLFDGANSFVNNQASVWIGRNRCVINRRGQFLIDPGKYRIAHHFSEGLVAVKVGRKWGYVNRRQTLVVKPAFDDADDFYQGMARVKVGRRYGYINKQGALKIRLRFHAAEPFAQGLAAVQAGNGRWGYLDRRGKWVVKPRFRYAWNFSEGLAPVRAGRRWGYITRRGRFAIPPLYDTAYPFRNGSALVHIFGKGITGESPLHIDKTGKYRRSRIDRALDRIYGRSCPEDALMECELNARIAALGETDKNQHPLLVGVRKKGPRARMYRARRPE